LKLNILSDLHLGQGDMPLPDNDADVVVLAGDIARPAQAVAWASRLAKPVVYVLGNHEFYGGSISDTPAQMRRLCEGTQIRILDDESMVIGNVRFLGSTLWTDFLLFGRGEGQRAAMAEAGRYMRDYSHIRLSDDFEGLFKPEDSAALFYRHAAWLLRELAAPHDGPTVVVTHHAPSTRSIHPRFEGSMLNACFVSSAEHLLDERQTPLWIHGHTHDSFDYTVNGTRVVCNPRGYARGVNENARFDPDLVVEV
jgi:predicted phosphodiesterase